MTPWTWTDRIRSLFEAHKTEMLIVSVSSFLAGAVFF
jgi:hypothetical protein